jgi:hypothetical protein
LAVEAIIGEVVVWFEEYHPNCVLWYHLSQLFAIEMAEYMVHLVFGLLFETLKWLCNFEMIVRLFQNHL